MKALIAMIRAIQPVLCVSMLRPINPHQKLNR
jgi:hypothetical protein